MPHQQKEIYKICKLIMKLKMNKQQKSKARLGKRRIESGRPPHPPHSTQERGRERMGRGTCVLISLLECPKISVHFPKVEAFTMKFAILPSP